MKVRMFDLRVLDNQINKELNYRFNKVLKHGKFFVPSYMKLKIRYQNI